MYDHSFIVVFFNFLIFEQVVAVNFLVLEKNIDHVNLQDEMSQRQPLVKIPLAGFILGQFHIF